MPIIQIVYETLRDQQEGKGSKLSSHHSGILLNFIFNIIKLHISDPNYFEKGGRKNGNVGTHFIFAPFAPSLSAGDFNIRPFKFLIIISVFNTTMSV